MSVATKPTGLALSDLPTELVLRVLQFSRPDGFESLLLTCKRFYNIGSLLLADHKACKRWPLEWMPSRGRAKYAIDTGSIPYLLRLIREKPEHLQGLLLVYVRGLQVGRVYKFPTTSTHEKELLHWLRTDAAWLMQRIMSAAYEIGSLLQDQGLGRRLARVFTEESVDPAWPPDDCHCWLATIVLLMTPQIELLQFLGCKRCTQHQCMDLPLKCIENGILPRLRKITVTESDPDVDVRTFARLLQLPLESLSVGKVILNKGESLKSQLASNVAGSHDATGMSCLTQLVLHQTIISPAQLSEALAPLTSLRSLILESCGYKRKMPTEPLWRTYRRIPVQPAFHELSDAWPPVLDSQESVQRIIPLVRERLVHLALTYHNVLNEPLMPPDALITDFKGLLRLTHIELDFRLLRPSEKRLRIIHQHQYFFPRHMADLLPASIEVIRVLLVYTYNTCEVMEMVGRTILERRQELPALRKCVFRNEHAEPHHSHAGQFEQLRSLWEDLATVGVDVVEQTNKFFLSCLPINDYDD